MNMLISWPMGFGIFVFFCDCPEEYAHFRFRIGSGIFGMLVFLGDCLDEYAHFVAYGIWSFCFFGTVSTNILI